MRQILSIKKQTSGRPQDIDAPSEGWTYETLAELPAGKYVVELGPMVEGADSGDEMPEDSISAGHTFAILARASGSWDTLCRAQQRTIEQQATLITKLYAERAKLLEGKEESGNSPLEMLAALAPFAKALLSDGKGKEAAGGSDEKK